MDAPVGTDIFVFGSNKAGIHGAGAAHYALRHQIEPMFAGMPANYRFAETGMTTDDRRRTRH